jgi:hypothetical protein
MSSVLRRNPMRVGLTCAWLLIGGAGWAAAAQDGSVPLDEGRRMFDAGMARYAALRARLEEPLPSFDDPRRDPWALLLSRRYLASAIRTARRDARPGSIFTPAAALLFRETIARAVYEIDIEGLVDVLPGEGAFALDLAVNEPIPAWALATVPAALVERLPPLPAAIEYRIAGGALVLWDTDAEILIDALPDSFVAP